MIEATDRIGDMLSLITRSFLNGLEEELRGPSFNRTAAAYKSVLAALTKNLRETRFEHFAVGTEQEYNIEAKLVTCIQRLAHNIGGLRSAAATQFSLLSQPDDYPTAHIPRKLLSKHGSDTRSAIATNGQILNERLAAIDEVPEEGNRQDENQEEEDANQQQFSRPGNELAAEVFAQFIKHLGPSMVRPLVAMLLHN